MKTLLLRGGRVVDPRASIDARRDLRVAGGIVVAIADAIDANDDDEVIDCEGCIVAPGFIDMHAHLRDPGNPEKETLASGLAAAVAGGFTAVACMPNTVPAIDDPALLADLAHRGSAVGLARLYPIAAITRGRAGTDLVDFEALAAAGAVAFSDDGNTIASAAVEAEAARRSNGRVVIVHCEDAAIKARDWHDPLAEETIVARDLAIALASRTPWHIAHLSTARAAAMLACVRASGARVTCEVTPHHLVFTRSDVERLGGRARVNPPLREESDVAALRAAVRDGTIDAFATDHAPHTAQEKSHFDGGAVGFTGLEIAVGAYAWALPDLPLRRFVELLCVNPARMLGLPGGTLAVGSPADVTVFADRPWTVRSEHFYSKGKATPFDGMTLPRRPVATIVGGRVVMRDGRVASV